MDNDNGWKSVKDKLPIPYVDVLGFHRYSEGAHPAVSIDVVFYNPKEETWIILDLQKNHIEVNVTHWMPLPSPPKTSDKER